ncbi:hypothetical protein Y032_0005g2401 [Ancylostoma ceylanicum]|uniref:Uncharacterized protein n=1 Tax=Ancylostoma ceylanicum TaxID=53326 RepID=A0A016VSL2_9BILA|nr:hypothetical protein Y032_0005g2401 [Ancylostoma ceylanicum]
MAKLYFIALAINSLLPALCTGAFCPDGQLDETQIKDYVLDQVNEKRKLLLDGNQKNGNSGDNLPPPKGMTQLVSHYLFPRPPFFGSRED